MTETVLALGDRVRFTGIVVKDDDHWGWVGYKDAPLPGFIGYRWTKGNAVTKSEIDTGFIVGKRRYTSMAHEEGMWIPDGAQAFTAYLVAYHLQRKPVMVRLDQIIEVNSEPHAAPPKPASAEEPERPARNPGPTTLMFGTRLEFDDV